MPQQGSQPPESESEQLPDSENPQIPGGYYYQPLQENGPMQQSLGTAFAAVGSVVGQVAGNVYVDLQAEEGRPMTSSEKTAFVAATGAVGKAGGQWIGQGVGFYIDNADSIVQNAQTFMQQANDYRSWQEPPFGN